jgi:hypothetical protein
MSDFGTLLPFRRVPLNVSFHDERTVKQALSRRRQTVWDGLDPDRQPSDADITQRA